MVVSMDHFLEALSFASPAIDKLDRDLFMYLILGKVPEKRIKIIREYQGDQTGFHFLSEEEARASAARREWLRR